MLLFIKSLIMPSIFAWLEKRVVGLNLNLKANNEIHDNYISKIIKFVAVICVKGHHFEFIRNHQTIESHFRKKIFSDGWIN